MSGYTKLFSSILNSTVWVGQTPATKLVWIVLLASADRDGVVTASVAGLAKLAEVKRAECEKALKQFLAPDPDSSSREHDGRRIEPVDRGWRILNHAKYRDLQGREDQLARQRERQKRYRDRHGAGGERDGDRDVTVTGVTPGDPIRSDPSPSPAPSPAPGGGGSEPPSTSGSREQSDRDLDAYLAAFRAARTRRIADHPEQAIRTTDSVEDVEEFRAKVAALAPADRARVGKAARVYFERDGRDDKDHKWRDRKWCLHFFTSQALPDLLAELRAGVGKFGPGVRESEYPGEDEDEDAPQTPPPPPRRTQLAVVGAPAKGASS